MAAAQKIEAQFDVEEAIAKFLQDPARSSLELPPMAADMRKKAKAIVDRHPELTSESYGLGKERCLHLFKKFSVKNTFIDDVCFATVDDETEPVVFRSMPTTLPRASLLPPTQPEKVSVPPTASKLTCGGKLDLSPIGEMEPKWPRELGALEKSAAAAAAPAIASLGEAGSRRLPTLLQQGCQVRNTFIHIDSGVAPDERSIQSMPHDMFRQCLEEEAFRLASQQPCPAGEANPEATKGVAAPSALITGTRVVIQGLSKLPAFNGKSGVIQSFDEETGRYSVILSQPIPGHPKLAKVKADNLSAELAPPPPPSFAPHLDERLLYTAGGIPSVPSTPLWAEDFMAASPLRLAGAL